ncbi:MAG TPA: metalloregulator ArsR/SmtB family transcription factor [Thermomicrobiales bacterium]|jgi:DNA-binding transcriptional ArsR family regulator
MGELVVGRPALQLNTAVSLPLDLVSAMSLLYRAVPGSGLDRWLVATRRGLSDDLRADLDLLHGFSGRLLYYMEEPVMRFEPLRPDRIGAGFDDLIAFLEALPAAEFRSMVEHALQRVHCDLGTGMALPEFDDEAAWRAYVEPALTTATADDVLSLVAAPGELKERTVCLIRGVWDRVYAEAYGERLPVLRQAADLAVAAMRPGFGPAFSELTGNRLPSTLVSGLNDVECVTFCPSYHLGSFVSYILYPPDLVVFFGAPELVARVEAPLAGDGAAPTGASRMERLGTSISTEDLLEGIRALGDPNRLRVIDLLAGGELYAQEIVGRLGIAQSAVSRHLSLLERAGLVRVRRRGGKRYYAVDCVRLDALADALRCRGRA